MRHPFLVGKNVYLRLLEKTDLNDKYYGWLNDPEVNRYLEVGRLPSSRASLKEFYKENVRSKNNVLLTIIDKKTDKHIGNVKLGPIDWFHRRSDFGILIGDKQY